MSATNAMTGSDGQQAMDSTDDAARVAANYLYAHLAELTEDAFQEMAAEDPEWMRIAAQGTSAELAAYEEARFRAVMAELALIVQARALGRYRELGR